MLTKQITLHGEPSNSRLVSYLSLLQINQAFSNISPLHYIALYIYIINIYSNAAKCNALHCNVMQCSKTATQDSTIKSIAMQFNGMLLYNAMQLGRQKYSCILIIQHPARINYQTMVFNNIVQITIYYYTTLHKNIVQQHM